LKKKVYIVIAIIATGFIGTLYFIEVRDNELIRKSKLEFTATRALYNEIETIHHTMIMYDDAKIPSEVLELSVRSLDNSYDMYSSVVYSLDLNGKRRVEKTLNYLTDIINIVSNDTLSIEDLNQIESYKKRMKDYRNITEKNLTEIKNKQDNYWWK